MKRPLEEYVEDADYEDLLKCRRDRLERESRQKNQPPDQSKKPIQPEPPGSSEPKPRHPASTEPPKE